MTKNKKKWFKIGSIILIGVLSVIAVRFISMKTIRNWVGGSGKNAPLIYIGLFSILPIFFFPVPVLAFGGGIFFGVAEGTLYTVIGAGINSTIMYFMTKYLGKDFFEDFLKGKVSPFIRKKFLTENQRTLSGLFFLFRLIPLVSYNLINYLSGLTKIKYLNYIITTIIGIIPGTVAFLNVGDKSMDIRSPDFIKAVFWLVLLIAASSLALKRYLKKENHDHNYHSDL